MSDAWQIWWLALCAAAAVNAAVWGTAAWRFDRGMAGLPADICATRRRILLLAGVYVLGCAFRSVLPMVDVPRICLHDTWISRIVAGRSVATIAELCFAAQWTLLLREAGAGGGPAAVAARVMMPLIVTAEIFSWAAVLRAHYLLHAIENSLWTLAAVLAVAGLLSVWRRVGARSRRFLAAAAACGALYVFFMASVDVPMYWARWQAQLAAGVEYLTLREGLGEVLRRCVVTHRWIDWREDVPWLSLYFTVAVWISIGLARVPPLRPAPPGSAP